MSPKFDYDVMDPETANEVIPCEIEYLAEPRLRTCQVCAGCGTAEGVSCANCAGEGILLPPFARFDKERVYRGMVPKYHKHPWVVTVDDVPYAAYGSYDVALEAVKLWLGYIDGLGRVVVERERCTWPACEGRVVRIVANKDAAT